MMVTLNAGQIPQSSKEIQAFARAKQIKQQVTKKAQEYQKLDNGHHDHSTITGEVVVSDLPKSNMLASFFTGKKSETGSAKFSDGSLTDLHVKADENYPLYGGSETYYHYEALPNGSKLYAAPNGDDTTVMLEKPNGTIFIDEGGFGNTRIESMRRKGDMDFLDLADASISPSFTHLESANLRYPIGVGLPGFGSLGLWPLAFTTAAPSSAS